MTDNTIQKPALGELAKAVALGDVKAAEELLQRNADFTEENTAGWDMLTSAANYGRTEIVRLLIAAGADVNRKSHGGITPLMRAARMGHLDVVHVLLENGADVSLSDNQSHTAEYYAETRDWRDVLKVLEEAAVLRERRLASEAWHNAAVKNQQGLKARAPKPLIIRRPQP